MYLPAGLLHIGSSAPDLWGRIQTRFTWTDAGCRTLNEMVRPVSREEYG